MTKSLGKRAFSDSLLGLYPETRNLMVSADFAQLMSEAAAFRNGHKAAGMKRTTLRRIQGTGHLPFENYIFAAFLDEGISDRDGGKQSSGVGV